MTREYLSHNLLSPYRPDTTTQHITRRAQMLEKFGSCINSITLEHSPEEVKQRLKRCVTQIRGFFPKICDDKIELYSNQLDSCRPFLVLPEAMKGNKDAICILALHMEAQGKPSNPPISEIERNFALLDCFEQDLNLVFIQRIMQSAKTLNNKFRRVSELAKNRKLLNNELQNVYRAHAHSTLPLWLTSLKPQEIAFQPFSISVVLSNRQFDRLAESPSVDGLHIRNSIFNFIRETDDYTALSRCIEHEEYHSICEASGRIGHSNPLAAFQSLCSVITIASNLLENCNDDQVQSQLEHAINELISKNTASVFLDLVHEELLTDFRAIQRIFRNPLEKGENSMSNNPFNSFLTYWSEMSEYITQVSGTGTPLLARYGKQICLEIDRLWPRAFDNYVALQAGCCSVEPEEARFTEALMHLFPPSQIHFAARICEKNIRNFPNRRRLGIRALRL